MTCLQLLVLVQLFLWRHYLCQVRKPPVIDYPSHNEFIYYRDNERVVITCRIKEDNLSTNNEFMWTQNGTIIAKSDEMEFDKKTGVLSIRGFSARFEATYRCIVSRTFDEDTPVVSAVSPAIYLRRCWIEPFSRAGTLNHLPNHYKFYSIDCEDTRISVGPITYRWYHSGTRRPVDNGDRVYVGLNVVYIEDRGIQIICSISAILRGVEYIELGRVVNKIDFVRATNEFLEDGSLRYSSPPITARRLSDARMECVFTKFTPGNQYHRENVVWFQQSGKMIQNSAKYQLQSVGKRLTIRSVTEDDEMFYTCLIYVHQATRSGQVYLNVTAEPVFIHGAPESRTVIQGEDSDFNCEAESVLEARTPGPLIWYINAEMMEPTYDRERFQLSERNRVLTVKNPQKATSIMCVQCEISNNFGTALANACLNVLLPIVIVAKPPAVQRVMYGDVVNLTVVATVDPALSLKYRWRYGKYGFLMGTTPPYVISNPETMEVYINTSLLPVDRLDEITGHFNIVVTSEYEKHVIGTDVIFIAERETSFPGESTTVVGQVTDMHGIVVAVTSARHGDQSELFISTPMIIAIALLALLLPVVIIASACFLSRKKKPEVHTEAVGHKSVDYELSATDFKANESPVRKTSSGNLSTSSSVDPGRFTFEIYSADT